MLLIKIRLNVEESGLDVNKNIKYYMNWTASQCAEIIRDYLKAVFQIK